jgi:hypothetical protein
MREEFRKAPREWTIPLELSPGKLLEGPFHRSLQEAIALMGDLEERKNILLYANHVPVAGCPNKL